MGTKHQADSIRKSAEMNNARWNTFGNNPLGKSNGNSFDECTSYISDFLSERQKYLSSLWSPSLKHGDVNNDDCIDVRDVVLFKKYILCNIDESEIHYKNADINTDGNINVIDLNLIMNRMIYLKL